MTNDAASLASQATSSATSSARPIRCSACWLERKSMRRLIQIRLQQWRHDEAGPDRVHPDPVAGMLPGRRLCHPDDAVLGRDVRARIGESHLAEDRGHVDHRPAATAAASLGWRHVGCRRRRPGSPRSPCATTRRCIRRSARISPPMPAFATTMSRPPSSVGDRLHRPVDLIRVGDVHDGRTRRVAHAARGPPRPRLAAPAFRSHRDTRGAGASQRVGAGEADP